MAGYKNLGHKQASKTPLKVVTVATDWREGDPGEVLHQVAKAHGLVVHKSKSAEGTDAHAYHVANRKMTPAEFRDYDNSDNEG